MGLEGFLHLISFFFNFMKYKLHLDQKPVALKRLAGIRGKWLGNGLELLPNRLRHIIVHQAGLQ